MTDDRGEKRKNKERFGNREINSNAMVDKLHSNHDRRKYFIHIKEQMKSKPQLTILVSKTRF